MSPYAQLIRAVSSSDPMRSNYSRGRDYLSIIYKYQINRFNTSIADCRALHQKLTNCVETDTEIYNLLLCSWHKMERLCCSLCICSCRIMHPKIVETQIIYFQLDCTESDCKLSVTANIRIV